MGEFKKATDDFKNTIEREVPVEELNNWPRLHCPSSSRYQGPSQSRAETTPTPTGEPAAPPKQIADLTPEAATKHDS